MRLDQDVVDVIASSRTDGNALYMQGQLDRKLYVRVAKALECAGGKWNRKAAAHLFDGGAAEAIEPILLDGQITDERREFDAFYTPMPLVARMVELARVDGESGVLEPSAGDGRIARAMKAAGCARVAPVELRRTCLADLQAITHRALCADFLTIKPDPSSLFDAVAMNPPFSKRQDVKHIRHAWDFLRPGGRLVAIASSSVKHRTDALGQAFRDFIDAERLTVEDLPDGTFRESGTMVNAVLICGERGA